MQVRSKLVAAILAATAGLASLVWLGVASLEQGAHATATLVDGAVHATELARHAERAFILSNDALAESRNAATLQEADAASARFRTHYAAFEVAWRGLQVRLTTPETHLAADAIGRDATTWRAAADPFLTGGKPTTSLPQQDRLDAEAAAIFGKIDALVAGLAKSVDQASAQMSGRAASLAGQFELVGLAALVATFASLAWAFLALDGGLKAAQRSTTRIADGDLVTRVRHRRTDEFGRLLSGVEAMRAQLHARAEAAQSAGEEARAGRLAAEARRDQVGALSASFDARAKLLAADLLRSASALNATADTMSGAARNAGAQAGEVSEVAADMRDSVQAASVAVEQLRGSIAAITQDILIQAGTASRAAEAARQTDQLVRELSESTSRIGQVVGLISEIASQTNLLALNATIEAARAGDAGRGFAVVASEVKALAGQTAGATNEIGTQIAAVQAAVVAAVDAISGIAEQVATVNRIASTVANSVEQQGAATAEIARTVLKAAESTQLVASSIGIVGEAARQAGEAAGNVASAAGGLTEQARGFSANVDEFIASLRAA